MEVKHVIDQLNDNALVKLLTEYYVNGRTWDDVADAMNYSLRNVMRLHKRALLQVQHVIELHTDLC